MWDTHRKGKSPARQGTAQEGRGQWQKAGRGRSEGGVCATLGVTITKAVGVVVR